MGGSRKWRASPSQQRAESRGQRPKIDGPGFAIPDGVRGFITRLAGLDMNAKFSFDHEALESFCKKHNIVELSFFGSVLRDDFRDDSDVDVLVTFAPETRHSLFDMVHIQDELSELLGRPAVLVERKAIERSENYIRRRHILENTEQVYRNPRAGWAEQLRAMAAAGDDKMLDEPTPTKFDEEEWEW